MVAETEHRVNVLANGLTSQEDEEIDDLRMELSRIQQRVALLPLHRSLSLSMTKIEEAGHWLADRSYKPPSLVRKAE